MIRKCYGCKRFYVIVLVNSSIGNLFKERIEGLMFFRFIGVDFVGFVKYFSKNRKEMKVYIVLYVCSFIRVVYLELLLD